MIAGDCTIGQCTIMSSNSMLHERSEVGDWVLVKGGCRIMGNVPPYVVIAHNPASYYGINAVIMRKHGFTEDQIDDVAKSYRHVYQCGTSVFNALRRIEADVDPSDIRDNIVDREGGEWHWSRSAGGDVNRNDDKAGFWKCPYHNSRMCTEVIRVLSEQ